LALKEGGSQLYWGSPSGWQYRVEEDEQDEEDKEATSTDKAKVFDSKGAMKVTLSKEPNDKSTQIKIDSQSGADPKRQTGDGTIWWYYVKSLSVKGIIISLIISVLSVVSSEFPSKFKTFDYLIAIITIVKEYGLRSTLDQKVFSLVNL
jgi:hypothetical protein